MFACRDLRDVGLCLATDKPVIGNDVDADGKSLIVVTGANEGGKSTFLRSVGAAQVMMQAGMFVTAASLRANVSTGVFTHFKREEDDTMTDGKFDEELARMSAIVDLIGGGSLLLCNESFASTNEREGSQIARGIVDAMLACGIEVGSSSLCTTWRAACTRRAEPTPCLPCARSDTPTACAPSGVVAALPNPLAMAWTHSAACSGRPARAQAGPIQSG